MALFNLLKIKNEYRYSVLKNVMSLLALSILQGPSTSGKEILVLKGITTSCRLFYSSLIICCPTVSVKPNQEVSLYSPLQ